MDLLLKLSNFDLTEYHLAFMMKAFTINYLISYLSCSKQINLANPGLVYSQMKMAFILKNYGFMLYKRIGQLKQYFYPFGYSHLFSMADSVGQCQLIFKEGSIRTFLIGLLTQSVEII